MRYKICTAYGRVPASPAALLLTAGTFTYSSRRCCSSSRPGPAGTLSAVAFMPTTLAEVSMLAYLLTEG